MSNDAVLMASGRNYTKEDLAALNFRRAHRAPFGMATFFTTADSNDFMLMRAREQAKDDAERQQLAEYYAKIDREEKEHYAMLDSLDEERVSRYEDVRS